MRAAWVPRVVPRALVLAGIWLVLAEGSLEAWWLGVLVVGVAALAGELLPSLPGWRLHWRGGLGYAALFIRGAVLGGAQVAVLALAPRRLDPAIIGYGLRVEATTARVLVANTVSLLPGTLSADLRGDRLLVHLVEAGPRAEAEIAEVEERVAALFGLPLRDRPGVVGGDAQEDGT